jgi:hypothetical protein
MAMSWTAPPPYPPRGRSRSRSPYRGDPYAPRGGYWDPYERERAWAGYERERAAMDYGRRGRSRSPGFDDSAPACPRRAAPRS